MRDRPIQLKVWKAEGFGLLSHATEGFVRSGSGPRKRYGSEQRTRTGLNESEFVTSANGHRNNAHTRDKGA